MFELLLNAVRLATSEDVRKSTSALVDLIRRSPEWERDICSIEARIAPSFAEQASLLRSIAETKLASLEFPLEVIERFKASYGELVSNAFDHGCEAAKGFIQVTLDISLDYVAVSVFNSKGRSFDLKISLEVARLSLEANPAVKRGRGLLLVSELADSFLPTEGNLGVKAVFHREIVKFDVKKTDGLVVIKVLNGVHNPSFARRLTDFAEKFSRNDVIVDMRGWIAGTRCVSVILELGELYACFGKRLVVLLSPRSTIRLPDTIVALDAGEALQKVGRSDLSDIW